MAGNTRLTELKELYNALTRAEKQTLAIYAKSYEDALIPIFRGTGKFVETLENNPDITMAEMVKELKIGAKDTMAINSLILRVEELIMQVTVLDQNLHRPGVYRNRFRIHAANEKKLIQAKIFLDRGKIKEVEKMLLDVQTKADKYEIPEQVVESLELQRLIALEWRSLRTFNRLESELEDARRKPEWHSQAEDIYLHFRLVQKREPFNREKLAKFGERFKELVATYPSDTVKYYSEKIQVALERLDYDFTAAAQRVQNLLDLVENSPALKSKRISSDLYYDLGYIQVQRRNLTGAVDAFTKGEKLVKNEMYENYRFKRDLLLLDLYQDKIDAAKDTVETRINSTYTRQKSFASTQYHYLRAFVAFAGKNHRTAVRQLSEEIKVMENPEIREALGHHVLLLMAASEMQHPESKAPAKDVKEAKEAAMKSVERLKKIATDPDLTARESTIIDLMLKLAEKDFNFKKAYKSVKRYLVRLRKQKDDLIWRPFSFEIMPIQYWYEARIDGRRTGSKLPPSPGVAEETPDLSAMAAEMPVRPPRKRGRPKGSKNVAGTKAKKTAAAKTTKTAKATKAAKAAKTTKTAKTAKTTKTAKTAATAKKGTAKAASTAAVKKSPATKSAKANSKSNTGKSPKAGAKTTAASAPNTTTKRAGKSTASAPKTVAKKTTKAATKTAVVGKSIPAKKTKSSTAKGKNAKSNKKK